MEFRQLFDRTSCTYTYLLVCSETRDAVLIDPVLEMAERDLEAVDGMKANLKYVINTHVHADHITGSGKLKSLISGVQSVVPKASGAVADITVNHKDKIRFGEQELTVLATPGHTPGCATYATDGMCFTGDTLLIRGCGRTDFQGGDPDQLYDSITKHIFTLPDTTQIWPGHDYSGRTVSSVGEEKENNPRLLKSKPDFVALMNEKFDGSNYPGKIDASLPANMVCGVFECGTFDPKGTPIPHPGGFVWEPNQPPTENPTVDPILLDFRGLAELEAEPGIESSTNIPSTRENTAENVEKAVGDGLIPAAKDTPIIAYCRSGARASLAVARLEKLGYTNCTDGRTIGDARKSLVSN